MPNPTRPRGLSGSANSARPSASTAPMSERQQMALLMQMTSSSNDAELSPGGQNQARSRDRINERGETSLHLAAKKGDHETVKKLLDQGVSANVTDFAGWTPLHEACNHGNYNVALALVKAGANVNATGLDDDTPLHDAAVVGQLKLVKMLVERGADPCYKNRQGKAPCDVATGQAVYNYLTQARDSAASRSTQQMKKPLETKKIIGSTGSTGGVVSGSGGGGGGGGGGAGGSGSGSSSGSSSSTGGSNGGSGNVVASNTSNNNNNSGNSISASVTGSGITSSNNSSVGTANSASANEENEDGNTLNSSTTNVSKDEDDVYEFKTTPKDSSSSSSDDKSDTGKNSDKSSDEKSGTESDGNQTSSSSSANQTKRPFSEIDTVEDTTNSNDEEIKRKKRKDSDTLNKDASCKTSGTSRTPLRQEKGTKIPGPASKTLNVGSKSTSTTLNTLERKSPCPSPKPASVSTTTQKATDSDVETDDGSKNSDSNFGGRGGPKVPPLKIVIPQQNAAGDQETNNSRNGKNNSTRNHQLPYVVASSNSNDSSADKDSSSSRCTSPMDTSKPSDDKAGKNGEDRTQRVLRSSHRSGATSGASGSSVDRGSNNSSPQLQNNSSSPSPAPVTTTTNAPDGNGGNRNSTTNNTSNNGNNSIGNNGNGNGNNTTNNSNPSNSNTQQNVSSANNAGSPSNTTQNNSENESNFNTPNTTTSSTTSSSSSSSSSNSAQQNTVELHPRKRKIKASKDSTAPASTTSTTTTETKFNVEEKHDPNSSTTEVHPHDQPITNCYQMFINIRKQIEKRQKSLFPVQPKPPFGFKDYLMNRCTYALAGKTPSEPTITIPQNLAAQMKEMFTVQEKERHKLKMQQIVEKEKLVLAVEQEILRVHGRAARSLNHQLLPFSVCTILKDAEVYNIITPEQEEKDRNARFRYNGRLFMGWLQDVDDKWDKIKEAMLLRHHNEAESLNAVQKMDWEWKMKELSLCEFKAKPLIEEIHVPMVHVSDDFDLLPA